MIQVKLLLDYLWKSTSITLQSFEITKRSTGKWYVFVYFEDEEGTQCDFNCEDESLETAAADVYEQVGEWMTE